MKSLVEERTNWQDKTDNEELIYKGKQGTPEQQSDAWFLNWYEESCYLAQWKLPEQTNE